MDSQVNTVFQSMHEYLFWLVKHLTLPTEKWWRTVRHTNLFPFSFDLMHLQYKDSPEIIAITSSNTYSQITHFHWVFNYHKNEE